MSDQTPAAPKAVVEAEAPDAAAETTPETPAEETNDVAALRREAAGHRVKAREAVEQRDALAARVERYQRAEVTRLAAAQLAQGEDVFHAGAELAAFLDEDGEVDAEKVKVAAASIASTRPGLAAATPSFDGGARPLPPAPGPSFADGFRKAARR
jgi:hypothetical protein